MGWTPQFKLYQSDGLTLQYTFLAVQDCNYPASPRRNVTIEGARGKGGVIIDGGLKLWDMEIRGYIFEDNYEDLIVAIDAMETAIVANTPYILKIDKTSTTTYEYRVKRVDAIEFPIDEGMRTKYQEYIVYLKVNSW